MTTPVATPTCPRCQTPAPSGARFCGACGVALPGIEAERDPLLGRTLLGRYRVESILGQGGMGRVYLGEQTVGRGTRKVAIKVLAPEKSANDVVVERFHREATTVLQLTHPCTVRLYDVGEDEGHPFLVMEFVAGERLAEVLARGPMPLAQVIAIVVQIAGSLDEAHRLGIVHRDLKPENVMLTAGEGRSLFVKVVDFGVAKQVGIEQQNAGLTARGTAVGTPAYMAPEQFMDMPADPRSDVYALGLLTYRMLAGALPWSAKNVYEWAERHAREPVPPLAERAPGLPPRVYTAVHRALAKLPSERPATAGEFARELSGLTPDADPWAAIASGELALGDTQNTTRPVRAPAITVSAPPVGAAKPIQRRHLAVATVLFVAAVAIGYASVLHFAGSQRSATGPRAAPDAGAHAIATPAHADTGAAASTPDASVDTGAVHPNWPRAQRVLLDGMSRAEHHDLDASIVALSTAQDLIGPTSIKLHDLRVLASQLGAERIRDDLSHHRCADAQNVARQLRRVGAEEQTFRLFGRGCAPP